MQALCTLGILYQKQVMVMKRIIMGLAVGALAALLFASLSPAPTPFSIVAGSENKDLEPMIMDWAQKNDIALSVSYLGSVDISRGLEQGKDGAFDAVWPAHSLWISLGDTQKVTKHAQSILRTPVVLGVKKSIAAQLGWIGRKDITVQMIAEAATAKKFRLAMTSATQSNSGASAYFGFLYAMAGNPDILTMANLTDPSVQNGVRQLLEQVDRSSGSSGWLMEALVANPSAYDAVFNYEATILDANRKLTAAGQEPLYIIYPSNGLSVADSPLAYVDKGDSAKEAAFLKLQEFLLSQDTQRKLADFGRRAGLVGIDAQAANAAAWNPEWGADLQRDIAPIPIPSADVIAEALSLYQTELRKPSLTVWVLDVSGSMNGAPLEQMKSAMRLLLDKKSAAVNLLQPSRRDVTIIIPFNDRVGAPIVVTGSNEGDLNRALAQVDQLQAGGGTDLYSALAVALQAMQPFHDDGSLFEYLPAIVAMTDGASDLVRLGYFERVQAGIGFGKDVPIQAIAFGNADMGQLTALTKASIGRLFVAGSDLAGALRQAKGYN